MRIIKEWVHEGLGKIICAEERFYKRKVVGPEEKSDERWHFFGRKEKIKFLSKEPKLYNVMFDFDAHSDKELEDIFYNRTLEQKEKYEKLTFIYKSFLNSIENIEKDLLKYCQEEFQEDYFQYYGYHFVDEDLPVWNEIKDLYNYFEVIKIDIFEIFYQIILKSKLVYEDIMLTGIPERDPIHLDDINMAAESVPMYFLESWEE